MFGWSQDSSNPTGDAPPYTENIPLDPRLDSEGLQSSLESANDVANGGIGDTKEDSLLGLLNAINCSAAQQTQSSSIRVDDSRYIECPEPHDYQHDPLEKLDRVDHPLVHDHHLSALPELRDPAPKVTDSTTFSGSVSKRKANSVDNNQGDTASNEDMAATKRQRNTMAARKYRQKGRDRIAELEAALKNVEEERDQLRLKLVRKEAEVDALREMLDR
ncbi:gaf domain nucleotide-binding protein [Colletotrichum chrysophilum]|uniref:Gaf domain nucleotide-binding protein n=1 Tax=Colletotrichum chrysophilum TaxID=1836956 RepID=A0AAD9EEP5_9PEZI|nr:gaf domain nucleotide-binding protein [Colletotrichum chrysophilum]